MLTRDQRTPRTIDFVVLDQVSYISLRSARSTFSPTSFGGAGPRYAAATRRRANHDADFSSVMFAAQKKGLRHRGSKVVAKCSRRHGRPRIWRDPSPRRLRETGVAFTHLRTRVGSPHPHDRGRTSWRRPVRERADWEVDHRRARAGCGRRARRVRAHPESRGLSLARRTRHHHRGPSLA